MLHRFLLPVLLLLSLALQGQTIPDESVRWNLDTDGNRITLRYKIADVKPKKNFLGVSVEAISPEGTIPLRYARGDIGLGVDPDASSEQTIRFDPVRNGLEDLGDLRFAFRVKGFPAKYADRGEQLLAPARQIPYLAAMALGAGVAVLSIAQFGEANDLYDIYSEELNPYAPVFAELSRAGHLDEANRHYRNAQLLAVGGGAALLAGTVFWINFRIQKSAWKRFSGLTMNAAPGGLGLSVNLQKQRTP